MPEGPEGVPEGPEGLPEGPEGLPGGPGGPGGTDVQTDAQMDVRMDVISPHSAGLCPTLSPVGAHAQKNRAEPNLVILVVFLVVLGF